MTATGIGSTGASAPLSPDDEGIVGLTTITLDMHPRLVHVHQALTPLRARAVNLQWVCQTLDAHGVEYFVVPGLEDRASVVGVPAKHRAEAVEALRALFAQSLGYVTPRLPKPRTFAKPMRGDDDATWAAVEKASVLRLTWYHTDQEETLVLGASESCDVEFWTRHHGNLYGPRQNRVARRVQEFADEDHVGPDAFTRLASPLAESPATLRTLKDFTYVKADDVTFPIDIVYTWVDGSDPAWAAKRAAISGDEYHEESGSAARFLSRDELRYSLRSLHSNAPWVRKIWIVTDDQRPSWLVEDERLEVVSHRQIFSDPTALPTFNSHSIESQLHHIDGLAEHFLYFNDDMFLGRPVAPQAFFVPNGITKVFYSQSRVPVGDIEDRDTPVDAALKNNRRLLEREFGRTVTQTFQHTPYVLRRSILQEIEDLFAEDHARTMHSRVRAQSDISIPSSLHHYFALFSGRAIPSALRYSYTQLAAPDLGERLNRLLERRDFDTFCLNDAYTVDTEIEGQVALLAPFLQAYFPTASPWERT